MNFSCSSGVHRKRDLPEAEAEPVAPDDGPGLPREAVALVEATIQKNANALTIPSKQYMFVHHSPLQLKKEKCPCPKPPWQQA